MSSKHLNYGQRKKSLMRNRICPVISDYILFITYTHAWHCRYLAETGRQKYKSIQTQNIERKSDETSSWSILEQFRATPGIVFSRMQQNYFFCYHIFFKMSSYCGILKCGTKICQPGLQEQLHILEIKVYRINVARKLVVCYFLYSEISGFLISLKFIRIQISIQKDL